MKAMSKEELRAFVNKHQQVIDKVINIMQSNNVDPADAELIFLHLVGLSAGIRDASLTDDRPVSMMASSWQFAQFLKSGM